MIIKNAFVYTEEHEFKKKDILVSGERIIQIADYNEYQEGDSCIIDGEECFAIPGLIDIHFHGAIGYDFCDASEEELKKIAKYEAENGILVICPATIKVKMAQSWLESTWKVHLSVRERQEHRIQTTLQSQIQECSNVCNKERKI